MSNSGSPLLAPIRSSLSPPTTPSRLQRKPSRPALLSITRLSARGEASLSSTSARNTPDDSPEEGTFTPKLRRQASGLLQIDDNISILSIEDERLAKPLVQNDEVQVEVQSELGTPENLQSSIESILQASRSQGEDDGNNHNPRDLLRTQLKIGREQDRTRQKLGKRT